MGKPKDSDLSETEPSLCINSVSVLILLHTLVCAVFGLLGKMEAVYENADFKHSSVNKCAYCKGKKTHLLLFQFCSFSAFVVHCSGSISLKLRLPVKITKIHPRC